MIEQIGGRKVLVVGVAVLFGIALVFIKGDVPANFLSLIEWAVGLFIVGNGIEHAAAAYASPEPATAPPAPQVDLSPVLEAIKGLKASPESDVSNQIKGIINQNAAMVEILGSVAQQTTYLSNYVAAAQKAMPKS